MGFAQARLLEANCFRAALTCSVSHDVWGNAVRDKREVKPATPRVPAQPATTRIGSPMRAKPAYGGATAARSVSEHRRPSHDAM